VPVALLLGFHFKLGVQGMYGGMTLGPLLQTIAYLALILKLSWADEARLARQRAAAAAAPL
jgi:MATE family multidrug resistance protein